MQALQGVLAWKGYVVGWMDAPCGDQERGDEKRQYQKKGLWWGYGVEMGQQYCYPSGVRGLWMVWAVFHLQVLPEVCWIDEGQGGAK